MIEENQSRLIEIDLLKSIGIIVMIMGHVGFGNYFDHIIHSFHMPMFFLISGYLFKESTPFFKFLKKKIYSLMIPYFLIGIIHYCIFVFINYRHGVNILIPLYSLFFGNINNLPIANAIWFLTSLFFSELLFYLILILNKYVRITCIIFLCILGYIIPNYFRLPFAIDTSFIGVSLMYIGYKLKNICFASKYKFSYLIFGFIIAMLNGYVNLRLGIYSNIILFYLATCLITYGLYNICLNYNFRRNFIIDELKYIGKDSITYLTFNNLLLLFLNRIYNLSTNIYMIFFLKVSVLLITLIILHVVNEILSKKRLSIIIGK